MPPAPGNISNLVSKAIDLGLTHTGSGLPASQEARRPRCGKLSPSRIPDGRTLPGRLQSAVRRISVLSLGTVRSKPKLPPARGNRRILYVLLAILIAALLAGPAPAHAADLEIDRYIEAEMELNNIPGLSLVVVEDGQVAYMRAYGLRNAESRQAMRVETPTELASVSKAFTALAILRLEIEGTINRNSAVVTYLPELNNGDWQDVTVSDLLRHRSGLRRRHDFLVPCCGQAGNLDLEGAPLKMADADLESPPGSVFSYANSNYVLLAAIVQRMSGAAFPSYMKDAVFQPLGLQRTTVVEEEARSWEAASPHEWQWGRVLVSPSRFLGWYGSSRIKASAADMGVYMGALLDPTSSHAGDLLATGDWWEGLGPDYDLGWTVSGETEWLDGQLVLEHTGSLWGADTAAVLAPTRGVGVAVLINMGTSRAGDISRAILRSRNGTPLPEPRRTSRLELPDVWARIFLASAAGLFGVLLWYGLRVARQVRASARTWHATSGRMIRSAVLASLSITLILSIFWGSQPPRAAFPTTIQTALPALVASVSGLLLVAAAAGLLPRLSQPSTMPERSTIPETG